MPYLQNSYETVLEVLTYPLAPVRKAAVTTLAQFCLSVYKVAQETNDLESHAGKSGSSAVLLIKLLGKCLS